jgi:hypothetical protein
MLDMSQAIHFKNFCYKKGKTWCEETFSIEGSFKEEGSDEVITGDNCEVHQVSKLSVEEIYKLYLEWFNYTLRPNETKRIFVGAKFADKTGEKNGK